VPDSLVRNGQALRFSLREAAPGFALELGIPLIDIARVLFVSRRFGVSDWPFLARSRSSAATIAESRDFLLRGYSLLNRRATR